MFQEHEVDDPNLYRSYAKVPDLKRDEKKEIKKNIEDWGFYTALGKLHHSLRSGVGVTKPISSIPLFFSIFSIVKTHGSYWISCLDLTGVAACCSSAVVTPVKYECDSTNLEVTFARLKILLMEKLMNGALWGRGWGNGGSKTLMSS